VMDDMLNKAGSYGMSGPDILQDSGKADRRISAGVAVNPGIVKVQEMTDANKRDKVHTTIPLIKRYKIMIEEYHRMSGVSLDLDQERDNGTLEIRLGDIQWARAQLERDSMVLIKHDPDTGRLAAGTRMMGRNSRDGQRSSVPVQTRQPNVPTTTTMSQSVPNSVNTTRSDARDSTRRESRDINYPLGPTTSSMIHSDTVPSVAHPSSHTIQTNMSNRQHAPAPSLMVADHGTQRYGAPPSLSSYMATTSPIISSHSDVRVDTSASADDAIADAEYDDDDDDENVDDVAGDMGDLTINRSTLRTDVTNGENSGI